MIAPLATAALLSAIMFTTWALYITVVEHPARLDSGVAAGWAEFRASYRRAAPWQAGFAATSLVTGAAVGLLTGHWLWLAGAVAVGAAIPFTLAVIMPINHRLLGTAALPDEEVRQLLHRWGRLHAVRTVLGAVSCLAFLRAVGGR